MKDEELKKYLLEKFKDVRPEAAADIIEFKTFNEELKSELESGDYQKRLEYLHQVADYSFDEFKDSEVCKNHPERLFFLVLRQIGIDCKPPF